MAHDHHDTRRVGFEIEYAGIALEDVTAVITDMFGGTIQKKHSAYYRINDSEFGDFTVEIDAIPLQHIAEQTVLLNDSERTTDMLKYHAGVAAGNIGAKIAPSEIVCPPIPVSAIHRIEDLCTRLHDIGAKGTTSSFHYAFGLHINPEAAGTDADTVLRHIQSFSLLYPWLKYAHKVDISRRITPYIDPYPSAYLAVILSPDYAPDITTLIRDYHAHNPSRNRAMDMLPLFAFLDKACVRDLYGKKEKINARPTYHYRLPNCDIGRENWNIFSEWECWLAVEALAADHKRLASLSADYRQHQEKWISTESQWLDHMKQHMEKIAGGIPS